MRRVELVNQTGTTEEAGHMSVWPGCGRVHLARGGDQRGSDIIISLIHHMIFFNATTNPSGHPPLIQNEPIRSMKTNGWGYFGSSIKPLVSPHSYLRAGSFRRGALHTKRYCQAMSGPKRPYPGLTPGELSNAF